MPTASGSGSRPIALLSRYLFEQRAATRRPRSLRRPSAATTARTVPTRRQGSAKVTRPSTPMSWGRERKSQLAPWSSTGLWHDAARMTASGGMDRERIPTPEATRGRGASSPARPRSRSSGNLGKASMPNGVPMSWLRTSYESPAPVRRRRCGHTSPRRRRARILGLQHPRHVDVHQLSTGAGRGGPCSRRVAQGTQFLLPKTRSSLWVAEELGRRYGLSEKWQFTLSATHANTKVIRVARAPR